MDPYREIFQQLRQTGEEQPGRPNVFISRREVKGYTITLIWNRSMCRSDMCYSYKKGGEQLYEMSICVTAEKELRIINGDFGDPLAYATAEECIANLREFCS